MDDEEEDMSQPISQLWGMPFRDVKYEDRATQIVAGQALTAVTATLPMPQSHNNNSISVNTLHCRLYRQPHVPFHGRGGLLSQFPPQFEPMEDRGQRQVEEEEEEHDGMAARPAEQGGLSVEAQIGRKLREIGDKFQQDHMELFMRHHRRNLPAWMRLTIALLGFLFPREAFLPRLRGEQR